MYSVLCAVFAASLTCSEAFSSTLRPRTATVIPLFASSDSGPKDDGNLLNGLTAGFKIFRKGISAGDSFKQSVADALAGPELDLKVATDRIDTYIKSAPVVIFSWTVSGFSTKAKKYLDSIGVSYEAIELDQPWSDGNPIRSALGRKVGRTSVPAIFVNGVYIGGCEDGPSDEAPGLVPLAFQGKLRPLLMEAGALKMDASVDLKPTGAKQVIVETAAKVVTPSSSSAKSMASASEAYDVPSTVMANQKKALPADTIVSSTVAANMIRALSSVAHTPAALEPTKAPTAIKPPRDAPMGSTAAGTPTPTGPKAAKGFYKKPASADELCPVEEECEL